MYNSSEEINNSFGSYAWIRTPVEVTVAFSSFMVDPFWNTQDTGQTQGHLGLQW